MQVQEKIKKHPDEVKKKISEGLKKYYSTSERDKVLHIEKHRESMAKAVGLGIMQYDLNNNIIGSYNSIAEASRASGVSRTTIQVIIKKGGGISKGFIWKRAENST